jgi:hypothetical protein
MSCGPESIHMVGLRLLWTSPTCAHILIMNSPSFGGRQGKKNNRMGGLQVQLRLIPRSISDSASSLGWSAWEPATAMWQ